METIRIKNTSLTFLKDLSANNNREWFNTHKERYLEAYENIIAFSDALLAEMNKHDTIETPTGKKSLFRIYKDVRFSKEKIPYNTHWNGAFKRATKKLRGGYYFHISPGNTFLAGGFWGPEPKDMQRIRRNMELNPEAWRKQLSNKKLIKTFGQIRGEQLNSAPRGFAKDHPAIDLLRYKQFLLRANFTDKEVCSPDFLHVANDTFRKMRPFFNFMSEVLTTDANGIED